MSPIQRSPPQTDKTQQNCTTAPRVCAADCIAAEVLACPTTIFEQTDQSNTTASFNISTTTPTLATTIDTTTQVEDLDDNSTALIGGIVGGIVALLSIIGLIIFIAIRRNRQRTADNTQPNGNDVSTTPTRQHSASIYGKVPVQSTQSDESYVKNTAAAKGHHHSLPTGPASPGVLQRSNRHSVRI